MRQVVKSALIVAGLLVGGVPAFAQLPGGPGPGGIKINAKGVIENITKPNGKTIKPTLQDELNQRTDLRRLSLKKLAAQAQSALKAGKKISDDVRFLGGLTKIEFVSIDAQSKDIFITGPAEPFQMLSDGRVVGVNSGRPVLRFDDLVSAFRCVLQGEGEAYCSIDPSAEGPAAAAKVLRGAEYPSTDAKAKALGRQIADAYGNMSIVARGVPAGSHFANAMIEADYRMKRLAQAIDKVRGLDTNLDIACERTEKKDFRSVRGRWWFEPNYQAFIQNDEGTIFQLDDNALKLFVEMTTYNDDGTMKVNRGDDKFTKSFNKKIDLLERRVPAFAELHNLFDLLISAGLANKAGANAWFANTALLDDKIYQIPTTKTPPTEVEPLVQFRYHGPKKQKFISFVYGGIKFKSADVIDNAKFEKKNLAEFNTLKGTKPGTTWFQNLDSTNNKTTSK